MVHQPDKFQQDLQKYLRDTEPKYRVNNLEVGHIFSFSEDGKEFKVMEVTESRIYYTPTGHGHTWESMGANSMQRVLITGKAVRRKKKESK